MIPARVLPRSRYLTRLTKAQFCSSAIKIEHDLPQSEFSVYLNESKAYVSYSLDGKKKQMSINHTEVPEVFQGKGVGKRLVETALQYAKEENLKVKIYCDFALKYYKDNESRFKDHVTSK